MKKILIFFVVLSLFSGCSKNSKTTDKKTGPGSIALTISKTGFNFVDFSFAVKSILLTHENGETLKLTDGFSVNLANFSDQAQFILSKSDVPVGSYTRILINLEFDENATTTYFDATVHDKPVTQYLRSQTGKKLGVDVTNFVINMPFLGNNLEVKPGSASHLNVRWDLNASTKVLAPEEDLSEDWFIEFKPIVAAQSLSDAIPVRINGKLLSQSKGMMQVQSAFDYSAESKQDIRLKNLQNVRINGEQATLSGFENLNPSSGYVALLGELMLDRGNLVLTARDVAYYDNDTTIVSGLVTSLGDETVDLLGGNVSSAAYVTQSNKTFKLPVSVLEKSQQAYVLFSRINVKLTSLDVDALFRGIAASTQSGPLLLGAGNEVVLDDQTEIVGDRTDDRHADTLDVFFVTGLSEAPPVQTGDVNETISVLVISNNGITINETVRIEFPVNLDPIPWTSNEVWRVEGLMLLRGNDTVLRISRVDQVTLPESQTYTYAHDYSENDRGELFVSDDDPTDNHIRLKHKAREAFIPVENTVSDDGSEATDEVASDDQATDEETLYFRRVEREFEFSEKVPLKTEDKTLKCEKLSTGLPSRGYDFQQDGATVIFELIQNNDSFKKGKAAFDADNDDFDGDYSEADIMYSDQMITEWLEELEDVKGKRLLIHEMVVIAEEEEGLPCGLKPNYILIRWIREGTLLDAYKEAFQSKVWRDVGVGAALAVGAYLALPFAALLVKKIFDKIKLRIQDSKYVYDLDGEEFKPSDFMKLKQRLSDIDLDNLDEAELRKKLGSQFQGLDDETLRKIQSSDDVDTDFRRPKPGKRR